MTYDPSLRVLTVLELLQAQEEVTGAELARRLEVSPRTVQRYILRLQDLGIPVEGRRGVGGAYRLKPGFRLPPLMFTGDEALALTLGLRALQLIGLAALAPAAHAAGAKLTRTLPPQLRAEVRALEQAVQFDASPWVVPINAQLLHALFRAVHEGRRAELVYLSGQGQRTRRQVEVYRTVHLDRRWYAVGRCLLRGELRSFRLDRIESCDLLDTTFGPRPEFDALAFLQQAHPAPVLHSVSVWVAAPPETLQGEVSVWHTDLTPEGSGTRLTCQRENLTTFAAFLLGLDVPLRVDSPPELRAVFTRLARRCADAGTGNG